MYTDHLARCLVAPSVPSQQTTMFLGMAILHPTAHSGEKSPLFRLSALAPNGATAEAANGKSGAARLIGPSSLMRRFTISRAGRRRHWSGQFGSMLSNNFGSRLARSGGIRKTLTCTGCFIDYLQPFSS